MGVKDTLQNWRKVHEFQLTSMQANINSQVMIFLLGFFFFFFFLTCLFRFCSDLFEKDSHRSFSTQLLFNLPD